MGAPVCNSVASAQYTAGGQYLLNEGDIATKPTPATHPKRARLDRGGIPAALGESKKDVPLGKIIPLQGVSLAETHTEQRHSLAVPTGPHP